MTTALYTLAGSITGLVLCEISLILALTLQGAI